MGRWSECGKSFWRSSSPGALLTLIAVRKDRSEYTAFSIKHILNILHPVSAKVSLPEQLERQGVSRDKVDAVIFRYLSVARGSELC